MGSSSRSRSCCIIVVVVVPTPHGAARLLPDFLVGTTVRGQAVIVLPIALAVCYLAVANKAVTQIAVLLVDGAARLQRVARVALKGFFRALVAGLCVRNKEKGKSKIISK